MLPFDFSLDDALLVPPADQWPLFDEVLLSSLSPSPSPSSSSEHSPSPAVESGPLPPSFPSPSALADMPIPPSRTSPRNKNPDHIPRPRNAFMLFRSAFSAAQKISNNIEHDNRHITRIIAHCWNNLSDAEKQVWRDKAAAEKAHHAERYPNYRFNPVGRANKPVKRNVRRNGAEDVKRCEKLAELVMAGKYGKELESAVKKLDNERQSIEHPIDVFTASGEHGTRVHGDPEHTSVPPFRSPLLPPVETLSQQGLPDDGFVPESPVRVASAHHAHACLPLTDPSMLDGLKSLWEPPRPQYYQPGAPGAVSSRSTPPLDHYQSIMHFVQHCSAELEQSVPDYSTFSWNQPDSFSYYH